MEFSELADRYDEAKNVIAKKLDFVDKQIGKIEDARSQEENSQNGVVQVKYLCYINDFIAT